MDKGRDTPDTSLKCIEEYYRKYSTDSNLYKYFSGTSVAYLPPLRLDDVFVKDEESPGLSVKVKPILPEKIDKDEDVSVLSGKSEISEKKLEWDSGADIGYHNYNESNKPMSSTGFRSLSLPTLKDLKDTKINFPLASIDLPISKPITPCTHSSSSSSNSLKKTDVLVVSYSSSPIPTSSRHSSSLSTTTQTNVIEKDKSASSQSTSSEGANSKTTVEQDSIKSKVAHLSETLNILKLAIGLPDAYSTPKFLDKAPAKLSTSSNKDFSSNIHKRSPNKRLHKTKTPVKVVNLTLSTPVAVQCIDNESPPTLLKNKPEKESPKDLSLESKPTSANSNPVDYEQTSDSDLNASNCESFEYFHGNHGSLPIRIKPKIFQQDLEIQNDSSVLQDDIDKAVTIIQQFFESRQLNYTKKRRYIKKIIHRIESKFQTRFLEDSSSNQTTSPEMFIPLKEKLKRNLVSDINFDKRFKSFSDSAKPRSQPELLKPLALKPPDSDKLDVDIKALKSKILSKNPTQVYISDNINNPTSSHNLFNSEKGTNSLSETPAYLSNTKNEEISSKLFLNSTETQVFVFENNFNNPTSSYSGKSTGKNTKKIPASSTDTQNVQSDCLDNFVKNEKAYQISWINNEIQHLTKLKKLLENPTDNPQSSRSNINLQSDKNSSKPHSSKNSSNPQSSKNSSKHEKISKTIYKVTSSSGDSEIEKEYVIKTQMNLDANQKTIFQLDGKRYRVEDTSSPEFVPAEEDRNYVINDIEVETKDSVTNIRINPFCEQCKESLCDCDASKNQTGSGSSVYESLEYPKPHSEQENVGEITNGTDYYDSLKKIFDSCHCIKGEKCRCIFVKNVLRYFGKPETSPKNAQLEIKQSNIGVQTKYHAKNARTATEPKTELCKCLKSNRENVGTQLENHVGNIGVQTKYHTKNARTATEPETELCKCLKSNRENVGTQLENPVGNIGVQTIYNTKNARTLTEPQTELREYIEGNEKNVGVQSENPTIAAETNTDYQTESSKTQTFNKGRNIGCQSSRNIIDSASQSRAFASSACVQTELEIPQIGATQTQTTNQTEQIGTQVTIKPNSNNVATESCAFTTSITQTEGLGTRVQKETEDTAIQSTTAHDTSHTQTDLFQLESGSQTKKTATATTCTTTCCRCDAETETKVINTNVVNTEVEGNTNKITNKPHVGPEFVTYKSQTSSTTDLNPPRSYATRSTQTQLNVESIGVEVGYSPMFDNETQTSIDFMENIAKTTSLTQTEENDSFGELVKTRARRQVNEEFFKEQDNSSPNKNITKRSGIAKQSTKDEEIVAKVNTVEKNYQASTINKGVPSQFSPDMTSKQTQTRTKKYPDIRQNSKRLLTDRTNGTSSSSTTKHSSLNSTDLSESKKSGYPCSTGTLCICCKSTSDVGSLFCNGCRKKYNIYKRSDSYSPKTSRNGYCSCSRTRYCKYCQCKLSKTSRSHGGIAYTLTLESFSSEVEQQDSIVAKTELEEIKMKVPKSLKQKSSKEKENYIKRNGGDGNNDKEEKTENDTKASYTLQEHLANNKPDFVNMADYRRMVITNSKTVREQKGDMGKFNFLENNSRDQIPRKLFSNKEMKEINKKHYSKLTKEKKINESKAKLKKADRLIADIFSKKLQQQVLSGIRDFPIDTVLVNF